VEDWQVTVDDERYIERTAYIFNDLQPISSNASTEKYAGTLVMPPEVDGLYFHDYTTDQHGTTRPSTDSTQISTDGNLVLLNHDRLPGTGFFRTDHELIGPSIVSLIKNDTVPDTSFSSTAGAGNFRTLRCRIQLASSSSGTDYEVQGFTLTTERLTNWAANAQLLDDIAAGRRQGNLRPWVLWSTSTGPTISSAVLHMPTHEPTEHMPLHVGGRNSSLSASSSGFEILVEGGFNPFEFTRDIYDSLGIRYSTDALQNLIDDNSYGRHWWRLKSPALAYEWLEDNIYGPLGVVPFQQTSDGKVAPRSIRAPRSSDVGDAVSTLSELTASNVAWPHPTWRQMTEDIVTRLRFEYIDEDRLGSFNTVLDNRDDYGADWIKENIRSITRDHDRIDNVGVHEREFLLHGVHFPGGQISGILPAADPDRLADALSRDFFTRYGDGPIVGELVPLTTAVGIAPGVYYRLTVPTFFNPTTQGRGGTRVVQAISVTHTAAGPKVDWLDAGPSANPLATPTIALSCSTGNPKHALQVVVGSLTSGSKYEVDFGPTTSQFDRVLTGTSSELTRSIAPLPSGRTYYARARQTQEGKITSNWTTEASKATDAITGPSALATSSVTGNTVQLFWTVGDTDYPVEVLVDQASTCPSNNWNVSRDLVPGSNEAKIDRLTLNSTHCVGVRHRDQYGGRSDSTSASIETTTDPEDSPLLDGLDIIVGIK
jgi:hypothetical protein